MAKIVESVRLIVKMDEPSGWTLILEADSDDSKIFVGMYYGPKETPSHSTTIDRDQLRKLLQDDKDA
jgi:hypothetical protein